MPTGFDHVPFGNLNALRNKMGSHVAAIMVETVQGEGRREPVLKVILPGCAQRLTSLARW